MPDGCYKSTLWSLVQSQALCFACTSDSQAKCLRHSRDVPSNAPNVTQTTPARRILYPACALASLHFCRDPVRYGRLPCLVDLVLDVLSCEPKAVANRNQSRRLFNSDSHQEVPYTLPCSTLKRGRGEILVTSDIPSRGGTMEPLWPLSLKSTLWRRVQSQAPPLPHETSLLTRKFPTRKFIDEAGRRSRKSISTPKVRAYSQVASHRGDRASPTICARLAIPGRRTIQPKKAQARLRCSRARARPATPISGWSPSEDS